MSPSLMGSSPLDKKIKGTLIADILHIVGMYPHDSRLLKKYGTEGEESGASGGGISAGGRPTVPTGTRDNTSTPSGGGGGGGGSSFASGAVNPFAFSSLSRMMTSQEEWRRTSSPHNIELAALGENESAWVLLLMVEDEFARAKSSQFYRLHPTRSDTVHYNALYRSSRFSGTNAPGSVVIEL